MVLGYLITTVVCAGIAGAMLFRLDVRVYAHARALSDDARRRLYARYAPGNRLIMIAWMFMMMAAVCLAQGMKLWYGPDLPHVRGG